MIVLISMHIFMCTFVEKDLTDAKDENGNWGDQLTVCPSSLDPIYIVAYYIKWVKNFLDIVYNCA